MDTTKEPGTHAIVGARIRKARQERGWTQERLAGPDFTKGYVSALERGAVRPSLKALEVFAMRLDMPVAEFLVPAEQAGAGRWEAMEEDIRYQLKYARVLVRAGRVEEAFELIDRAERGMQPLPDKVSSRLAYRVPFLRGLAYLHIEEPALARPELQRALRLANADAEAVASVRDLLGVAYYLLDEPQLALQQHLPALHAVEAGLVRDPSLRFRIYRNLGNDYSALGDTANAINIYEKSLELVEDVDQQAAVLGSLAMTYRADDDWSRAKLYTVRALRLYESADNLAAAAMVGMDLAEILTAEGRYGDAEGLLAKAGGFLSHISNPTLHGNLQADLAELALGRGQLDTARKHASAGIELIGTALGEAGHAIAWTQKEANQAGGGAGRGAAVDLPGTIEVQLGPWSCLLRSHARALHVAARVEEERGNHDAADGYFRQALHSVRQTGYREILYTLHFSYGEILAQRGAYMEASEHFRAAAQSQSRGAALGI